jgi:hypothetical protein
MIEIATELQCRCCNINEFVATVVANSTTFVRATSHRNYWE